jgi:ankyrin repeat protein
MPMLFLAIAIGDVEITKLLIEEGADVNAKLSDGHQMLSPLAFALRTNQEDIAQLLTATAAKKTPESLCRGYSHPTIGEPTDDAL